MKENSFIRRNIPSTKRKISKITHKFLQSNKNNCISLKTYKFDIAKAAANYDYPNI